MAQGGDRCANRCALAIVTVAVLTSVVLLLLQYYHPPPRYYASILSISRVDDDINLEFNISLAVECRKPLWGRTCLGRGTNVAVAYHGVGVPPVAALANGATGGEVCSGWYKQVWELRCTTVVARTSGGLPSSVVDGVIAEAQRGIGVFDVTFWIHSQSDGDAGKMATCVVKPFSGKPATACDVQCSK